MTQRTFTTVEGVKLAPYASSGWTAYGPQPDNGPEYKAPDGTLWHADEVRDYHVKLWTINGWGATCWQTVTLQEFREKWTEYNRPATPGAIAELYAQMNACDPRAEIGTPEHKRRFALKDQIFAAHKAAGSWPAAHCYKCQQRGVANIGSAACCESYSHHLYDCCLHCGNDERPGAPGGPHR